MCALIKEFTRAHIFNTYYVVHYIKRKDVK